MKAPNSKIQTPDKCQSSSSKLRLGRLMACSSQLDMFMTSRAAMNWYAEQFIAGNYSFDQKLSVISSQLSVNR